MARVGGFLSEDATRGDHPEGRGAVFHCADLDGRRMRAQNQGAYLVAVEGVLGISCRMILRDVKRFEVVVIEFDFRAVENFISHGKEEIFELASDLRNWMQAAAVGQRSRERRIEIVCPPGRFELAR